MYVYREDQPFTSQMSCNDAPLANTLEDTLLVEWALMPRGKAFSHAS